jgi:hypothetical protein
MLSSKEHVVGHCPAVSLWLFTDNFCIFDYIRSMLNVLTWGVGGTLFRSHVTGPYCTATNMAVTATANNCFKTGHTYPIPN